jgi:hypothetical protein
MLRDSHRVGYPTAAQIAKSKLQLILNSGRLAATLRSGPSARSLCSDRSNDRPARDGSSGKSSWNFSNARFSAYDHNEHRRRYQTATSPIETG